MNDQKLFFAKEMYLVRAWEVKVVNTNALLNKYL